VLLPPNDIGGAIVGRHPIQPERSVLVPFTRAMFF
jgi:hypothetical protein